MSLKKRLFALVAMVAMVVGMMAGPAMAQNANADCFGHGTVRVLAQQQLIDEEATAPGSTSALVHSQTADCPRNQ